jgi:hypothetical protein
MTKQLACLAVVMALGAACTQQSPQQTPASGADSAAAPASGSSSAPASSSAQPTSSGAAPAASAVGKPSAPPKPTLKEITIPSGTSINVTLDSAVASDTSKAEDTVRGKLSKPIVIGGTTVAPAGSEVVGTVISAAPSGKVKGRASIAFRFDRLMVRNERVDIRTARIAREAAPTKGEDAKKVGIGAGAGALIGAIAGGGKGAAIGGAVGAGAGTGVVMATKGDEVRLGPGAAVSTTIQEAVKVLVPID